MNCYSNRITRCLPAALTLTLCVFCLRPAGAQSTHRPITDFTNAQGTTSVFGPTPDYAIGFSTSATCIPPQCDGRIAVVDYPGGGNRYLISHGYPSLGTTISGDILERPLADGRAEVTVTLHTTNALTFVSTWNPLLVSPPQSATTNPRLFGSTPTEVLAGGKPALADSHLVLTFKNPSPGAAMPDVVAWLALGNPAPQELVSLYFDSTALGTLHALAGLGPEDTPGKCVITETGVLFRGTFKGATSDGFPVESVDLHAIGR